jgi:hypothetical protein
LPRKTFYITISGLHLTVNFPYPPPAELDAVRADFWEMMEWWRDRKLKQIYKSVPRDLQPQTYHVERRYIELI